MDDEGGRRFDALFADSYRAIVRTVWFIVGDWEVAREVAQDAFATALVHWRKVSAYDNPGAWVRRVAIRDAVRARRRAQRGVGLAGAAVVPAPTIETTLDVRAAIMRLPVQQRAAVVLHYLHDLPVRDVAAELRCSEGTVKTHLARARDALSVLLRDEHEDAHG
jgi:RNA polymerase sigma-70 factor (ECF subfamily)